MNKTIRIGAAELCGKPLAFSRPLSEVHKVRVRIERILSYKKMSVASLGLCALAAALTVLLLTN